MSRLVVRTAVPLLRAAVLAAGLAGAAALLAASVVVEGAGGTAWAQDADAAGRGDARLATRVRGVATWRRYVWTLERPLLDRITDDLEAARAENPADDTTRDFLLAYAHLAVGRRDQGVAALERTRAASPRFVPLMLLDGILAVFDGRGQEAVAHLDAYLEALAAAEPDANFGAELLLLGTLHRGAQKYHLGNADGAVADYEAAIAVVEGVGRPPARQLVQRLALAYQSNEEHAKAEGMVLGLLRRDPANPYHYFNLGVLKAEQFEYDEAITWYRGALRKDPRFADAHAKLASVLEKMDRLREMRASLDAFSALTARADTARQAELQAGYAAYYWRLSRRLDAEGRAAERDDAIALSVAACRRALELKPYCLRALQIILRAARSAGLPDAEVETYRERVDALRGREQDSPDAFRRTLC